MGKTLISPSTVPRGGQNGRFRQDFHQPGNLQWQPCIKGTRVMVSNILGMLASSPCKSRFYKALPFSDAEIHLVFTGARLPWSPTILGFSSSC